MEVFRVADFVLVTRLGKVPKLVVTWTGSRRLVRSRIRETYVNVIMFSRTNVCVQQVHAARMLPYSETSSLNVTQQPQSVVACIYVGCQYWIAAAYSISAS